MHLSAHTWMRPESLRRTLERISELGYTSVELAGEPSLYPIEETRQLLCEYNVKCWGTVTLQHGTRDLTTADPAHRKTTIQYMKDVVSMAAELGGTIVTVVPARVGKLFPSSSLENEWKWAVEGLREVAVLAKEKNIRVGIEPLNRFETYFLNRVDQTLALADAVGHDCEKDLYEALQKAKHRIVDFHAANHNRLAAGDGNFNWQRIITELRKVGYDGALAVECMPPIDRTPIGNFGATQLESGEITVPEGQLQFIIDHGSGVLSDAYYTGLMRRSAETLRPLLG
ncbi:hypothetical protein M441DRAFT_454462 [Trichoderma asperellum CBS 433.97]|uniref:Xylose isomerase-like TIM barrel domain-containing protein n=1 Tax=Trichoderma asperellum (strain ATCC 204424 / CBS 433.97 / NBRC 101777) TaxID=1042311 RepID=A0A2T3YR21_TRIA4|nr:hypothetical protein M441DRAFT_454462 [Trichoderma asperellum CBS 433.97]PTB34967.1 hypothetical protein M441DRAFT_454462 [Trichoderma asperellum CBS 433.97]